jgi:hypothetical protein
MRGPRRSYWSRCARFSRRASAQANSSSTAIGITEMMMIARMTSEKFCYTHSRLPKK